MSDREQHHLLEITADGLFSVKVICNAPPGSPCRMVCDCDEVCSCDRSGLRDLGECNQALWINESDDAIENGEGTTTVPIALAWDGDHYYWKFVPHE